jgi:hypothetical protein
MVTFPSYRRRSRSAERRNEPAVRAKADASRGRSWADETPTDGQRILRGPGSCRFDGQIVQPMCMPKERFPRRVFSAEIFPQLRVI